MTSPAASPSRRFFVIWDSALPAFLYPVVRAAAIVLLSGFRSRQLLGALPQRPRGSTNALSGIGYGVLSIAYVHAVVLLLVNTPDLRQLRLGRIYEATQWSAACRFADPSACLSFDEHGWIFCLALAAAVGIAGWAPTRISGSYVSRV